MTEYQKQEVYRLQAAHGPQWSALGITRCLDNVDYREIEQLLGERKPTPDVFSPALRAWWMQQPWVWRPDNPNPITAPWERITA